MWTKLRQQGNIPEPTVNSSTCLYKDKILLFGGQINKEILCNDTFSYNLSNSTWQLLLCTGEIPTKRISHTAVIYSDYMIIFGGYHESQMRYCSCNALNILNLRTLKWFQTETTGPVPCERQCHSSIVFQGDMYIFGGYAGNSDVVLNDMYKLNLDNMVWSKIEYFGHFIPSPRYFHVATLYSGKMYIHGGREKNNHLNDFYSFDFEKKRWNPIITTITPSKRAAHSGFVYNDSLFIFGGYGSGYCKDLFFNYDFETNRWKEIELKGIEKSCSQWIVSDEDSVYLGFGIAAGGIYLDEIYKFEFEQHSEPLQNVLRHEYNIDFSIQTNGKIYKCHKSILSQNDIFEKLINSTIDDVLIFKDISYEVMDVILNYLYSFSEKITVDKGIVVDVILKAKEFNLINLEKICLLHLKNNLNVDSFTQTLLKGHFSNHQTIKVMCFNYFHEHRSEISLRSDFKELLLKEQDLIFQLLTVNGITSIIYSIISDNRINSHLKKLYSTKKYHDVVLVSSDFVKIKSHKVILTAFSEYFSIMFTGNFKESSDIEIEMDIKYKTLELVLQFIYNIPVALTNDFQELEEIFCASDMLQLKKLHSQTISKMVELLNSQNSKQFLKFCVENRVGGKLRNLVLEYVSKEDLMDLIEQNYDLSKNLFKFNE
eukprot:gene9396-1607_t